MDLSLISEKEFFTIQKLFINNINNNMIIQLRYKKEFNNNDITFLENFFKYETNYLNKNIYSLNEDIKKERKMKLNNLIDYLNDNDVSDWLKKIYSNIEYLLENNLINNFDNDDNKFIL